MRVLLVPPTFRYATEYPAFLSFSDFPSGWGYLAASLKQAGHEVQGCNPNNIVGYANAYLMLQDTLSKKIAEVKPELIGLGGLCIDYKFLRDAISIIRQTDPKIPIVLGGQIVTNDAEFIFNDLKPDYAVVGEGENSILQIIEWITEGNRFKGNIVHSEQCPLDALPFPDYSPFGIDEMLDEYSMATRMLYRYSRSEPRPFNIVASRGCPFACSFCIDHHRSYRPRSMTNIMEEIKISYEKYKYNILLILDELFVADKERMVEFCNGILEGKKQYGWDFDWMFQTHANAKLDLATLQLAKKAGCYLFSYGLESASPTVLKSMDKHLKVQQVIEAMALAKDAKVGFSANLIFGDIAETQDTMSESLAFWHEYCRDNFVFLSNVLPYPGSKLFNDIRAKGFFRDKREYYEKIDSGVLNMTTISEKLFPQLMQLIQFLEQRWLFTKMAPVLPGGIELLKEEDRFLEYVGGDYYKIKARCPYCGEEVVYRERLIDNKQPFFLGTGCVKCNRKIRVEVS